MDLLTCELEEGAFQSQAGGRSRVVQLPPEMVRQLQLPQGAVGYITIWILLLWSACMTIVRYKKSNSQPESLE